MATVTIAHRFSGPPGSANGGYFSGLVAALAARTVAVRLLKPPPLDVELQVLELADGSLELRSGAELIAKTRPDTITAPSVTAPAYIEAVEASRRCAGFTQHPFPT